MIILDSNVISELTQAHPAAAVLEWVNRQAGLSLWTTSVTVYEARYGVLNMPKGRKRDALEQIYGRIMYEMLGDRILHLDAVAAERAAVLGSRLRGIGRTVDIRDLMIAGIAATHGAALATRNTRHFADTGLTLVDPWAANDA